jgi:hypothetical protein
MTERQEAKIGVFVDVRGLSLMYKNAFVDYEGIRDWLMNQCFRGQNIIRWRAYVIPPHGENKGPYQKFLSALGLMGYSLFLRGGKEISKTKNPIYSNVEMVVDIIELSQDLDVVVLVSGDGDLVPLVEYLQRHGKQVIIIGGPEGTTSRALIWAGDGPYQSIPANLISERGPQDEMPDDMYTYPS